MNLAIVMHIGLLVPLDLLWEVEMISIYLIIAMLTISPTLTFPLPMVKNKVVMIPP